MRAIALSNKIRFKVQRFTVNGGLNLREARPLVALDGVFESGLIDIGMGIFFSGIGLYPPLFAAHRFIEVVKHKAQKGVSG